MPSQSTVHFSGKMEDHPRDVVQQNSRLYYPGALQNHIAAEQDGIRNIGQVTGRGRRGQNTIPAYHNIPPTVSRWMYNGGMVGSNDMALYINPISEMVVTDTIEYLPNEQQLGMLNEIQVSGALKQQKADGMWQATYSSPGQQINSEWQQQRAPLITLDSMTSERELLEMQDEQLDVTAMHDISAGHYRTVVNTPAQQPHSALFSSTAKTVSDTDSADWFTTLFN